jgi:hypothetical protein
MEARGRTTSSAQAQAQWFGCEFTGFLYAQKGGDSGSDTTQQQPANTTLTLTNWAAEAEIVFRYSDSREAAFSRSLSLPLSRAV